MIPPDDAALREAALRHLSRYAATEAGLRRVLHNRIRRWARAAEAAGQDADSVARAAAAARARADAIAARLVAAGAVDDAAFAAARARRLLAGGRSARAALAHLAAKGVDAATARAALAGEEVPDELTAALVLCRRRRLGPFACAAPEAETRRKWLAALARAGFPGEVARRALATPREEAEALLARRP
ncbi:MAG: RecX family transcriptional regulator [Roseococcus sp.]|nr:RecX family transcriptional regulator [Roseococcus sp.]